MIEKSQINFEDTATAFAHLRDDGAETVAPCLFCDEFSVDSETGHIHHVGRA